MAKKYRVAGIMSGTSLDGLDIAVCDFTREGTDWNFNIVKAETFSYSDTWKNRLCSAHALSGLDLMLLDSEYGKFIGKSVKTFLTKHKLKVELVASHGHTVFHQPTLGITVQIGNGANIAAESFVPCVSNFRNLDVALHGQGAPLVPIGDELLFPTYDYCLNLGGFANISYQHMRKRIAYDICPANILLNYFSRQIGYEYDENGRLGSVGQLIKPLLDELNGLNFYSQKAPKSLGREWVEKEVLPIFNKYSESPESYLRTLYEHIATQIVAQVPKRIEKTILVTGGGANNQYLIQLMQSKTKCKFIVPDKKLIDFKEALLFGFLGVLRWRREKNCLASVTGARHDNIGGIIHLI
jgi:anhydro-N-acetylmuramic acid kinase